MKKIYVILLCFLLMLTSLFLSGCEEKITDVIGDFDASKPNYINVTITASASLFKWKWVPSLGEKFEKLPGVDIKIKMDKASGEGRIFYTTTGEDGWTPEFTHSFKVYREQPVNIHASLYPSVPAGLSNYSISQYDERLIWEDIHSQADFGESFHWEPTCEIIAYPPDYEDYFK